MKTQLQTLNDEIERAMQGLAEVGRAILPVLTAAARPFVVLMDEAAKRMSPTERKRWLQQIGARGTGEE